MASAIVSRFSLEIESSLTGDWGIPGIFHLIYGISVSAGTRRMGGRREHGCCLAPTEEVVSQNTVFLPIKYSIHPIYFPHENG